MTLKMEPLDDPVDWPELGQCLHEAYTNPPQPIYRFLRPMFDTSPEGIAQSIEHYTAQMRKGHQPESGSYWFKVVDTESGRIVSGCWWKIYHKNPFDKVKSSQHTAWPEGGQREFASAAINKLSAVRQTLFNRPHIFLYIIFTHPEYRNRGAADMTIRWGIAKAQEMQLPMWLDAFPSARDVYTRYGFHSVNGELDVGPERPEDVDDDWKRMEQQFPDLIFEPMWRPADGPYVEGKSVPPWKVDQAASS